MSGTLKRVCLFIACYLVVNQVQAQVRPAPGNNPSLSPRPIRPFVTTPGRPAQQVMPAQHNYTWYESEWQKRRRLTAASSSFVRKSMAIANLEMPAKRSYDWYRQHVIRSSRLQQPAAAGSRPAAFNTMPAQRSYDWYLQHINASRQRTQLSTMPGNRN